MTELREHPQRCQVVFPLNRYVWEVRCLDCGELLARAIVVDNNPEEALIHCAECRCQFCAEVSQ